MSKHTERKVFIDTRTVGQAFGTCGVIRAIGSRRVIVEADAVRPYGFTASAAGDARELALEKGWTIVETNAA